MAIWDEWICINSVCLVLFYKGKLCFVVIFPFYVAVYVLAHFGLFN